MRKDQSGMATDEWYRQKIHDHPEESFDIFLVRKIGRFCFDSVNLEGSARVIERYFEKKYNVAT
jgi:hypothetical protein